MLKIHLTKILSFLFNWWINAEVDEKLFSSIWQESLLYAIKTSIQLRLMKQSSSHWFKC